MGAALEFVESGRNGWLVRAGDVEALLEAMREAALMPASRLGEFGRRARESVREHTLQSGAKRFFDYAQQVITQW
jgi:glycosyltransferase involved in cell wall biosynthesis